MAFLDFELKVALESVVLAGEAIRQIYESDFEVRMKGKNDPVTEADLQSHQIIFDFLRTHFPEDPLLSEEDLSVSRNRLFSERVWILDPMDGTREFVEKNPEFAISLGLCEAERAILGIVHNPVTREIFWGCKGRGYGYGIWDPERSLDTGKNENENRFSSIIPEFLSGTCRRKKISGPEPSSVTQDKKTILVSHSESRKNLFQALEEDPIFRKHYKLLPTGSIAYKLGLLSAGKGDLVLSFKPKNEWDICGGIAILEVAGYTACSLDGRKTYRFNQKDTKTLGLLAGREDEMKIFFERFDFLIQNSLRKN